MSLRLSSPWVNYYRELNAFFKESHYVSQVIYDELKYEVKIYVTDATIAAALDYLLAHEVKFGNITLSVIVVPPNNVSLGALNDDIPMNNVYSTALAGHMKVSEIQTIPESIIPGSITYVIFEPEVVQYFTDDLSDAYGLRSTLYQDIANEIFEKRDGVFFCTDRIE